MKIFIDSANLDEIRNVFSWGIAEGVTTNPSLIKKALEYYKEKGKSFPMDEYILNILEAAGKGHPVSLEVLGIEENKMLEEAQLLYEKFNFVAENVVIKIPINPEIEENSQNTFDGIKVIRKLIEKGIPVNATLIMTPIQALLASKAGANYVSPFIGRIDDYLRSRASIKFEKGDYYPEEGLTVNDTILEDNGIVSGIDLLGSTKEIFDNYDIETEIIAASIRNVRQVREVAEVGAHIATIPFEVIKELLRHPKTMEGMINFLKDKVKEYEDIINRNSGKESQNGKV